VLDVPDAVGVAVGEAAMSVRASPLWWLLKKRRTGVSGNHESFPHEENF
jgi:hypothetical protein